MYELKGQDGPIYVTSLLLARTVAVQTARGLLVLRPRLLVQSEDAKYPMHPLVDVDGTRWLVGSIVAQESAIEEHDGGATLCISDIAAIEIESLEEAVRVLRRWGVTS